MSPKIIYF